MNKRTVVLVIMFILACGFANAAPVTLTFDDNDQGYDFTSSTGGVVPNGYGGLNWANMYFTGTMVDSILPAGIAFNGLGFPALVTSANSDFDFLSAYLGVAGQDSLSVLAIGLNLQEMRLGGFQNVTVASGDLQKIDFNFNDIDTLFFYAYTDNNFGSGYAFLMDNFTYEVAAIPIPASLLLLGSALLGLVGFRRAIHQ